MAPRNKSIRSFIPRQDLNSRNPDIIKKGSGDTITININDLENIIIFLRRYQHYKIKDLRGELLNKYNNLTRKVELLYGTKEFNILSNLLKKHFGNIKFFIPGTIGAYCGGCLNDQGNDFHQSCSPICAGSIPLGNYESCNSNIIVANYKDNKYDLNLITSENKINKAFIFLDVDSINNFRGFSDNEKDQIKHMGVNKVTLFGSENSSKKYEKISDEMDIKDCKKRHNDLYHRNYEDEEDSRDFDNLWIIVLIIIIIIIIALFASYKYH